MSSKRSAHSHRDHNHERPAEAPKLEREASHEDAPAFDGPADIDADRAASVERYRRPEFASSETRQEKAARMVAELEAKRLAELDDPQAPFRRS